MPARRYCAFISYRHADNAQEGRRWAEWLHRALERYVVPSDLAGTTNLRGETIPASLYPIFRDEDEMPANADLATGISAALEASSNLIVLCSPRSAVSPWVPKEVREFKELGRTDRILAVMIAGEPNADDPAKARDGVMPEEECFCHELRFGVASADGSIDWTVRTEPLAADLRPGGARAEGFVSADAYREHLTLHSSLPPEKIASLAEAYRARLELGLLKVTAGLLGVPLGQLTERDAAHRAQLAELEAARERAKAAALERANIAEHENRLALEQRLAAEQQVRAEQERRIRLQRIGALTLGGLLAASLALAGYALQKKSQATRAAARAERASAQTSEVIAFALGDLYEQLEGTGRLDILDQAATHGVRFVEALRSEPPGAERDARLLMAAHNIGRVRLGQGKLGEARTILRDAAGATRDSGAQDRALVVARAHVLDVLCDLSARTGENTEGQRAGEGALASLDRLAADAEVETLRAEILINLADLQRQAGQHASALGSIDRALAVMRALSREPGIGADADGSARRSRAYVNALLRAGDLATARGDIATAEALFLQRLAESRESSFGLVAGIRRSLDTALSHDRLARHWLSTGRVDKAADSAGEAAKLWAQLRATDPFNREWERLEITTEIKRGQILLAAGQAAEAEAVFARAVAGMRALVKAEPQSLAWRAGLATAESVHGDAFSALGDVEQSLAKASSALELRRGLHDDPNGRLDVQNTRNLVLSLIKIAITRMNMSAYAEAAKLAHEAVPLARSVAEGAGSLPDHRALLAAALETAGETFVGQGRQPEGLPLYEQARVLRLGLVADFPRDPGFRRSLAANHEAIGGLHKDRGAIEAARAEFDAALRLRRALAGELPGSKADAESLTQVEQSRRELDAIAPPP